MHHFGTSLGVLQLSNVDVFWSDTCHLESSLRRINSRPSVVLESNGRCQYFKTSEATTTNNCSIQEDRLVGVQVSLIGASQDEGHAAFTRRAEHVLRQRVRQHQRIKGFLFGDGLTSPGHGVHRAVTESLFGDLAQGAVRDSVFVHVTVDLHSEELRGERQTRCAIPVAKTCTASINSECAALVLVKTNRDTKIENSRTNRVVCREQSRTTRGTTIGHVDELQTGQSKLRHHGVSSPSSSRTAESELDIFPFHSGISAGTTNSNHALFHTRHTFGATEFVHSNSDDGDFSTHCSLPGSVSDKKLTPPARKRM